MPRLNYMAALLLLLLATTPLSALASLPVQSGVLYVRTDRHQPCPTPSAPCHSFVEYLHGYHHLFASNTTLHFLRGEHIIDGTGGNSQTVSIDNLEDFTMEGPAVEPPGVTLRCTQPHHFYFANMTRLVIQNIKITNCSPTNTTFPLFQNYNPRFSNARQWLSSHKTAMGSLVIENTHDLALFNVHISEGSGYGFLGFNLLGTTKLRNCHFHNNSGNDQTKGPGGNVLLAYICLTIAEEFEHLRVEISQCEFSFGRSYVGSGGLEIASVLVDSEMEINSVLRIETCHFYSNMGTRGADLAVYCDTRACAMSKLEIDSCHFHNAASRFDGGSVSIDRASNAKLMLMTLSNSTFKGNSANGSGGAVVIHGPVNQKDNMSITVANCNFSSNRALKGGGAIRVLRAIFTAKQCTFQNNTANNNGGHISFEECLSLSLVNSWFERGRSLEGEGGGIHSRLTYLKLYLKVLSCTFSHNEAARGGGLAVEYASIDSSGSDTDWLSLIFGDVRITGCYFVENYATYGGGMYLSVSTVTAGVRFAAVIAGSIQQSWFIRNSAQTGGGFEARFISTVSQMAKNLFVINTTQFAGNTAQKDGSAINVFGCAACLNGEALGCKKGSSQMNISLTVNHGLFVLNSVDPLTYKASTININSITVLRLQSTRFISNRGSAILASSAEITAEGRNLFQDNTAIVGGVLHFDCYNTPSLPIEPGRNTLEKCTDNDLSATRQSRLTLTDSSFSVMRNNLALQVGGAMAVNTQCTLKHSNVASRLPCFFRAKNDRPNRGGKVVMDSNKAMIVGNELHGGQMETCIYGNTPRIDPVKKFRSTFVTKNRTLTSEDISSDPIRACFCIYNTTISGPYCLNTLNLTVFPGQQFTLSVVPITSLLDTSKVKYVKAELFPGESTAELGLMQEVQAINRTCDGLTYSIRTMELFVEIHLTLLEEYNSKTSVVYVNFLACSLGLEMKGDPPQCDCAGHLTSTLPQITCDITSNTILLPSGTWIGNFSGGLSVHPNCPFDYCNDSSRRVKLDSQDAQCSHRHSGVLCGACQPGLSLALGSSRCLPCSSLHLLLLLPFAAAGIVLVATLQKCDLTVAKGTLGGIMFYANIVQANGAVFFPHNPKLVLTKLLATITAWINLDLGIQMCFADGLNAMERAWLQFIFPVYVWIIAGAIIYTSRYSITMSKLTGSNAVPVLATLFILSYTKLLRTIIVAVSPIAITDENGTSHLVWIADGNVAFMQGAHIPLFLVAVVMAAVYIAPLTALVTFAPCLQARSANHFLRWVTRMKPLLDAYTGPYTHKHCYWTGLMLLARIALFVVFAANSTGDPKLNLLSITMVCVGILVLPRFYGKLYRTAFNQTLEAVFLVNLLAFSSVTHFLRGYRSSPMSQEVLACTSVGLSLLLFVLTACWRVWQKVATCVGVRRRLAALLVRLSLRQPPNPPEEVCGVPRQEPHAQPTVSVIDMRKLREPLLTN